MSMHKFGVINLYAGVILTFLGMILGFYELTREGTHTDIGWLAAVPAGVLLMFLGTSMVVLSKPVKNKQQSIDPEDL